MANPPVLQPMLSFYWAETIRDRSLITTWYEFIIYTPSLLSTPSPSSSVFSFYLFWHLYAFFISVFCFFTTCSLFLLKLHFYLKKLQFLSPNSMNTSSFSCFISKSFDFCLYPSWCGFDVLRFPSPFSSMFSFFTSICICMRFFFWFFVFSLHVHCFF